MEKELEIYYDHYKDSFAYLRTYIKQRDKYFLCCIILLALIFVNSMFPFDFELLSKVYFEKAVGLKNFKNFQLLNSFLLFCILSAVIKYFQVNITIERQYTYLHHVEKQLSNKLSEFNIFRESKGYLNNYPIFGSIVHRIYTIVFPALLILLLAIRWWSSINSVECFKLISFFSFDSFVITTIIILTIFYLLWVHCKDFKYCKH